MDIEELWVFNTEGLPLAEINNVIRSPNSSLFGGLISAVQSISGMFYEKGLSYMELGDSMFVIKSCLNDSITIVCRANKKKSRKKVEKIVEIFSDLINKKFQKIINWMGNVVESQEIQVAINDLYFQIIKV